MRPITLLVFSFFLCFQVFAQQVGNYKPTNRYVNLSQTNLPIVFINTGNAMILKDDRIAARMMIIYNGEGELNYADTLAHPSQKTAYKG
ncbi:MAG: spore coat protein CotH, partial [Parabacteroides sp.]|nr:spore coat protein CotH [Parabacteroides sp.]